MRAVRPVERESGFAKHHNNMLNPARFACHLDARWYKLRFK